MATVTRKLEISWGANVLDIANPEAFKFEVTYPDGHVLLFHGTSVDGARSLLEHGFSCKLAKQFVKEEKAIWPGQVDGADVHCFFPEGWAGEAFSFGSDAVITHKQSGFCVVVASVSTQFKQAGKQTEVVVVKHVDEKNIHIQHVVEVKASLKQLEKKSTGETFA